jgi:hypothetical protein
MEDVHQKISRFSRGFAWMGVAGLLLSCDAPTPPKPPIAQLRSGTLQAGDLVFRLGVGYWSPMFAHVNPVSGFSHVGVLIEEDGRWKVLHADADDRSLIGGVIKTELERFQNESKRWAIKSNLMPAAEKAAFLASLQSMWSASLPFDSDFDLSDQGTKVYCTELVWLATQTAGKPLGEIAHVAGRKGISVDSIHESSLLGPAVFVSQ